MAADLLAEEERPPTLRRYIVNDSTVEKMGIILGENPNGLLVFRDEIQGFCAASTSPAARITARSTWSVGRATALSLAIVLGVAPSKSRRAAFRSWGRFNPALSRPTCSARRPAGRATMVCSSAFNWQRGPTLSGDWVNVDKWPNKEARDRAYAVVERLADLDP